jgi:hypothetical protein
MARVKGKGREAGGVVGAGRALIASHPSRASSVWVRLIHLVRQLLANVTPCLRWSPSLLRRFHPMPWRPLPSRLGYLEDNGHIILKTLLQIWSLPQIWSWMKRAAGGCCLSGGGGNAHPSPNEPSLQQVKALCCGTYFEVRIALSGTYPVTPPVGGC